MVDVFISYSRTNQAKVRQLAEAVKALGYQVWWDDELPPHKSYGDVITEKIGMARAAIVVWSDSAVQSEWVRAEADVARNQKKLIQTALDAVMPPMPFNQIQFADIGDWNGEADHSGWRKVKASLADLCGPPGSPPPERTAYPMPQVPPPPPPEPAPEPVAAHAAPSGGGMNTMLIGALCVIGVGALVAMAFLIWGMEQDTKDQIKMAKALEAVEEDDAEDHKFRLAAVTDDPDGVTNVRAEANSASRIVDKVVEGEVFTTYEQQGNWWRIRTADDTIGYMYRPMIRLIRDGLPDASKSDAPDNSGDAMLENLMLASPRVFIPDSDSRHITKMELDALDPVSLRLARNEIYARKGYRFRDERLRAWFRQFDWYRPTADKVTLNEIEAANVALIAAEEQRR